LSSDGIRGAGFERIVAPPHRRRLDDGAGGGVGAGRGKAIEWNTSPAWTNDEGAIVADSPNQERLGQDLGLGGKLSERSPVRLLNRDGTFNVRRNTLSPFHPYNAYNTLLTLPVPRLLALMAAGYLAANLLFASLYWLAGPGAIAGTADGPLGRFEDCMFFSVQTLATIGYGRLVPSTRAANVLVSVEALVGLLGFAILSGLLFARFTRPTARISFSRNAIIAPYRDGWALMFRLANLRNHDLTDVHAIVSLARWIDEGGQRKRHFDQLALERPSIVFMPLHWVVVHPIDAASPFRGMTLESFGACDPEVVCLISAADETFAQTVHARTSYDKADIVWGARFRDMYLADTEHVAIDLTRLHDTEDVTPPVSL
jgi:inward rectifier potassium channel